MRTKILLPVIIVFLLLLIVILSNRWRLPPATANILTTKTNEIATGANVATSQNNAVPAAQGAAATAIEPIQNDRENTNEAVNEMESKNKSIAFFGRVLDQDGNPLPDVRLEGQILRAVVVEPVPGGDQDQIIQIDQKSDSEGRFEIHNASGRALELDSIQKAGYDSESWSHSLGVGGGRPETPVIFKMWSTNIHEQLITSEKKFQIAADGKPYFIDLSKGEISQTDGGDLKVWIKLPDQMESGKNYDWSCEVDVLNGGLQESDSYSMFSAPAEGYTPSFSLKKEVKGKLRASMGEKRFYITVG